MNLSPLAKFLLFCIPLRILLAYAATHLPEKYLPAFGLLLIIMGLGFMYLYFTGSRMNAPEAGPSGTWWANLRPIYGALFIVAGIYAIRGSRLAWIPLLMDVLFGIASSIGHYKLGMVY